MGAGPGVGPDRATGTVRETGFETETAASESGAAVRQRKERRGYRAVGEQQGQKNNRSQEHGMSQVIIDNPVINSPFEEPRRHFRFTDDGITDEIVPGRRRGIDCRWDREVGDA